MDILKMELDPIYFEAIYFACGTCCVIIGFIYTIFILKDFRTLSPKLPCYKSSQILFIIGCFARGFGYIAEAVVMMFYWKDQHTLYMCDPITIGIPSYILTISYLFLFYLWTSICVNIISNDSTTGLKEKTKIVFNSLLIFIISLGIVLTGVVILSFIRTSKYTDILHEVEVLIALLRDFITATIILINSIIIIRMSDEPICSFNNKESVYFLMLFGLILPLYVRSGSLFYFLHVIHDKIDNKMLENFINTAISALIAELFPCLMILITRKRSGLLSVYETIN